MPATLDPPRGSGQLDRPSDVGDLGPVRWQMFGDITARRVLAAREGDGDLWWHEMRASVLSASVFPAAVGEHPYMSAGQLAGRYSAAPTFRAETDAMRIGAELEAVILERQRTPLAPLSVNVGQKLFAHETLPWLAATPDAWHTVDGVLCAVEVKATSQQWSVWGPPTFYRLQAACVAEVIGAPFWRIVWAEPDHTTLYAVHDTGPQPMPHDWAHKMGLAEEFAAHVWPDNETAYYPLPATSGDRWSSVAREVPDAWDRRDATEAELAQLALLRDLRGLRRLIEDAEREARANVLASVGSTFGSLTGPGGGVVATIRPRETTDVLTDVLRDDHPDVWAACTVKRSNVTLTNRLKPDPQSDDNLARLLLELTTCTEEDTCQTPTLNSL